MNSAQKPIQPEPAVAGRLDLRFYLDLLWRQRALVGAAAVVGFVLAVVFAYLQTPEYQAHVLLQIEPPPPTFMSVSEAMLGGGNYYQNADFYNTQFRVLQSRSLGEKVVDRLKLKEKEPYKSSADPGGIFMSAVQVQPIPDSRLVQLLVTDPDPRRAALLANTMAEVYIRQSSDSRVEAASNAYAWLKERLQVTEETMRAKQAKLIDAYKGQYVPEGTVSVLTTSITKLNEDLMAVQGRRIALEAALKQIAQQRQEGRSLDSVPQVAADALAQTLAGQVAALNLELSRLTDRYKAGHPEVQKVQAQIAEVQRARQERTRQIVTGLESELSQLRKQEGDIKSAIGGRTAEASSQGRSNAELDALRKESESSKNLYDVLLQKLNESDIAKSIVANNVSLVETALPPTSPVRPQKKRLAVIGLFLGLILGVGLVLGRDFLDNTLKDPDELERYLHLDVLAAVPRYDDPGGHMVTEAYQNLRTALIFGRREEGGQVVLIAGTAPQEGKTTTLVNLAMLLASAGERTVAVDFDLRRAQLHNRLEMSREPGVTTYFVQHERLDTLIRPTEVANLFVLTAGPLPPNPPALMARKAMADLMIELRLRFDWVLLDSPPLASVTDAQLLARHADQAVLVVQYNHVDKKLVKRAVGMLRRATPWLLGVVFNAVDYKAKGYHYYYYDDEHGREKTKTDEGTTAPAEAPTPAISER